MASPAPAVEPGLEIPPRPAAEVTVAPATIGDHISAAGSTVLNDVLDRLRKGERVIVTSVEQLTGEAVQATKQVAGSTGSTITMADQTTHHLPAWATRIMTGFAAIGGVSTPAWIWLAIHKLF